MSVIVVGALRGSPGATRLAVDLARSGGECLIVEADPDGGCLAARLGLASNPGLTELAGASRGGLDADELWRYAQPLDDHVGVIVANPSPVQVLGALRAATHPLADALRSAACRVIVDVGRLRVGGAAAALIAAAADDVIVVARDDAESALALRELSDVVESLTPNVNVRVVVTGDRPHSAVSVAGVAGVAVWGFLPVGRSWRSRRRRRRVVLDLSQSCLGRGPDRDGLE